MVWMNISTNKVRFCSQKLQFFLFFFSFIKFPIISKAIEPNQEYLVQFPHCPRRCPTWRRSCPVAHLCSPSACLSREPVGPFRWSAPQPSPSSSSSRTQACPRDRPQGQASIGGQWSHACKRQPRTSRLKKEHHFIWQGSKFMSTQKGHCFQDSV